MAHDSISRRDFIRVSGMAAIGIGARGCASLAKPPADEPRPEGPAADVSRRASARGNDFDAVVIGTGMGGSAAGAIAALNGLKTLIVEKNPRPGGSCSCHDKDGFRFDTGARMSIRGNNGPFGGLWVLPLILSRRRTRWRSEGPIGRPLFPQNTILRAMTLPVPASQRKSILFNNTHRSRIS